MKDVCGDEIPEGYEQWTCGDCGAMCNFEAMQMCLERGPDHKPCPFDIEQPESNHEMFAFIKKTTRREN